MADPVLTLWNEIEAAETLVGDSPASGSTKKTARHALERLRRRIRPGGNSAGDKHSIARFRADVADIVASVDVTASNTTILTGPTGGEVIAVNTATWTFSGGAGDTFEVKLDAGAWGAPSGNGTHTVTGLSAAAHTFNVRAIDQDGNVDATPATASFTYTP